MPDNFDFGENGETIFADIILPVPVSQLFTYRVPRGFESLIKNCARVVVPFGKGRVLTGVVVSIHHNPPKQYQAKYIAEILDETPLITRYQLDIFQWIADYYMCSPGEVMNVALPAGLKITSQSKIQANPDFNNPELLTDIESDILIQIKEFQSLTYEEIGKRLGDTNATPIIKSLIGKRAILLFEEVQERYKPKLVKNIKLNGVYEINEQLIELINYLEKWPKQQQIVLQYLSQVPVQNEPQKNKMGVAKKLLIANEDISESALSTLVKKGIFEEFEVEISRFPIDATTQPDVNIVLTPAQARAKDDILTHFQDKDYVLLHGITGSGKTEVYISLAQDVLQSGGQVLFLLPEIALTTQMVVRLKKVFGDKLGIYHSKFSDNERVEVWKGIVSGQFSIVVGVRSAIFLPFDNLGLIIVDEEHESSYKQFDPAPRYHARDVAMVMAKQQYAKVLLGSATPSVETNYAALQGRYGLVKLTERYANATLPQFTLIDTKIERKQRKMKNEFSSVLTEALKQNFDQNEQSIIFQNRRGYAPYLQCEQCAWIGSCQNCDVSLTYHLKDNEVRCHYCGYKEEVPKTCPQCGSVKVRTMGYGTEKLEDVLKLMYAGARVARMDFDTTRAKNAYQKLIEDVEQGNVDILVGTQMISKGLDFERVSLVGVLDSDRMIHYPDFRAAERAFQLITQVSGRAGRRADRPGRVLIQTSNPSQRILQHVINNDYDALYEDEIVERQNFGYPPFTRLIKLIVKHQDIRIAEKVAHELTPILAQKMGATRVLGPEPPLVPRVRNQFLFEILIKLEREGVNFRAAKAFIQEKIIDVLTNKQLRGTDIIADVDCL